MKIFLKFILVLLLFGLMLEGSLNAQQFISFDENQTKSEKTTPTRKVVENPLSLELEYNIPGAFEVTKDVNGKEYKIINIEGFGHSGEIGNPMLPARQDLIALPGIVGGVKNIEILDAKFTDLQGYLIHPMLEPASDTKGAPEPEFQLNYDAYEVNAFNPDKIAEITGVQIMKGIPLGFLKICPVQYNPVTKTLRVYSEFRIKIEYAGSTKSLKSASVNHTKNSLDGMRGMVINPGFIPAGTQKSSDFGGRKDYIIITHSAYLNAAERLAEWKQQLGYTVEVVSKDFWTSEIIDMELKSRYESWVPKPDYFVIIGDHDGEFAVPGNLMTVYDADPFTSDNPYSCMNGPDDYLPDMARGRLSVRTVAQADMVVDRIIEYEKNPPVGNSFYNTTLNCAYFQHASSGYAERRFCQTSEEIRNFMMGKGYNVNRIYSTDASDPRYWNKGTYSNGEAIPSELHKPGFPWVPAGGGKDQIISEFNTGRFLIFHRDHGYTGGRGWADPYFTLDEIPSLTNVDKLPVVFSINCHTGQFIEEECFAEKLQRSTNGGAVSILAAAQSSYSGSNDALVLGFYDAIWNGLVLNFTGSGGSNLPSTTAAPIYAMGDIMNYGLVRMNETWPRGTDILSQSAYQAMLYHCFGDPAMGIRTTNPSNISATVPTSVSCNATSINISGSNVSDAIVTLTMNGKLIAKTQLSGGSGTLSLEPLGNNTNGAVITISKHNYIPIVQNISITGTCNYAPAPDFTPSAFITMAEYVVKFKDESKYNPDQWEWTFTPNDVVYVNGTSANSQNPEVKFTSVNNFTVALTATNSNGVNTTTKADLIATTAASPYNFTAVPNLELINQVSWTKYPSGPNVLLVSKIDNSFGTPLDGTAYSPGSTIPGGGTVIYVGSANSFKHSELNEGTSYQYKIWGISSGNKYSLIAASTKCNSVHTFIKAYEEGFELSDKPFLPEGWVSETNGTGSWNVGQGEIGVNAIFGTNTDGWVFTQALQLKAGEIYEFRFKYVTTTDYLNTSIEVAYGTNQSSIGMTSGVIYSDIDFGYVDMHSGVSEFSVSSTGIYYLGFHQQHATGNNIEIDDIIIRNKTTGHSGYWDGTGSTNWNQASNWSDGNIPDENTTVIIPEWCTSYPVITGNADCKEMFIRNGNITKVTINNGGNLNVKGNLWVGDGVSGEFEMNGGMASCEYFCTHENSTTDINGGTLNINKSWVRTPEDGWHFIRGNTQLSGGKINVADNVTFGGKRFTGIADGPVYMTVGGKFRILEELFTITDGTVELTGTSTERNVCTASNPGNWSFNNVIIHGQQDEKFEFKDVGNGIHIENDLTIVSGNMYTGTSYQDAIDSIYIGGNFLLKEGVTFNAWSRWDFIVNGDLLIEPNVTINQQNNITVRGQTIKLGAGNNYPSVSIASPLDNTEFNQGDNIIITANASDSDGNISAVEFFKDATKIGQDNNSPYSFSWNNALKGNYRLFAKAIDNNGANSTSLPIGIIINNIIDTEAPSNPSNLHSTGESPTTVDLSWTASTDNVGVIGYIVIYGTTELNIGNVTNYTVTSLTADTPYTFTVKAKDAGGNKSGMSNSVNVTTDPSDTELPTAPSALNSSAITSSSVDLSWTASTDNIGVTDYIVIYNATELNIGNVTNYTVTGLTSNIPYTFTVKAKDAAGNVSPASNAIVVRTLRIPFCDLSANSQQYEWITGVEIGSFINNSGNENGGYSDFTNLEINLTAGDNIPVTLTPNTSGYTEQWKIWIDYNGNSDFTDAGDLVFSGGVKGNTVGNINILSTASGTQRMRIAMRYSSLPESSCGSYDYGEVEDYTVIIEGGPCTDPLQAPTALNSTGQTINTISLNWTASAGGIAPCPVLSKYNVYRNGVNVGSSTTTNYTNIGLTSNTSYNYIVTAEDTDGTETAVSNAIDVSTLEDCTDPLQAPTTLNSTEQTINTISLSWTASAGGTAPCPALSKYNVYRNGVNVGSSTTTNYTNTGLTPNTSYNYTVTAEDADGTETTASNAIEVTTLEDCTEPLQAPTALNSTGQTINTISLNWTASAGGIAPCPAFSKYNVYRNGVNVGSSTTTNYTNTGLTPNTSYNYIVTTEDADGTETAASNAINVTTLNDCIEPLQAPTALNSIGQTINAISLNWTASAGGIAPCPAFSKYNVYRNGVNVASSTTTNYEDTGLTASTEYTYTIKAEDAKGSETGASNSLAVFTADPVTYNLTVTIDGNGSVSLNPSGDNYIEGTEVQLSASPNSGWQFDGWSGDLTEITTPWNIVMNADKNITATFTLIPNDPPIANANGTYNGTTNNAVAFSSVGSDDTDGNIVTYLWEFGDGNTSNQVNPSHIYTIAGTYNVKLTVTDDDDATGVDSTNADIIDEPSELPIYCQVASKGGPEYVANVQFGSINNTSVRNANGYTDNTLVSTDASIGSTNTLSVTIGDPYGSSNKVTAWLDWNRNGIFEANETYSLIKSADNLASIDITVPTDADIGPTGMRIMVHYYNGIDPCTNNSYGEVEDYAVNITTGGAYGSLSFDNKKKVEYYPNPTSGFITVNNGNVGSIIKVINMSGDIVKTHLIESENGDKINLSDLQSGMYMLLINDESIKIKKE